MEMGVGGDSPLGLLAAAVDAVLAWSEGLDASSPELGDLLVEQRHQLDRLELAFSRTAGAMSRSGLWDRQGYACPEHFVKENCNVSGGVAYAALQVGAHGSELPRMQAALLEGQIGFGHMVAASRLVQQVRSQTWGRDLVLDEDVFLCKALTLGVRRYESALRAIRHRLAPASVVDTEQQVHDMRSLKITRCAEGGVGIEGFLDDAAGDALESLLRPLAKRMGREDDRTAEQRMADALADVAMYMLGQGAAGGTQLPHVQVVTTLETLVAATGAPTALLDHVRPVSGEALRRLACDCGVKRILLDPQPQPIEVGREKRTITPAQRKALHARDRHCRWPGCERPVKWTSAHHIWHWALGGPSDLDNYVSLCWHHHFRVHEGGWSVVKLEDGALQFVPPVVTDHLPWVRELVPLVSSLSA